MCRKCYKVPAIKSYNYVSLLVVGKGSQARFDSANNNLGAGAGGRISYLKNIPISSLTDGLNITFNYVSGTYHGITRLVTEIGEIQSGGYSTNTSNGSLSFGNQSGFIYTEYLMQTSATGGGASEVSSFAGSGYVGAGGGGMKENGNSVSKNSNVAAAEGGQGGDGRGGYSGGYTYSVSDGCKGYYRNNWTIPLQSIFEGTGKGGNGAHDNTNGAGGGGAGYGNGGCAESNTYPGYGGGGSVYNNLPQAGGEGIFLIYYHFDPL